MARRAFQVLRADVQLVTERDGLLRAGLELLFGLCDDRDKTSH